MANTLKKELHFLGRKRYLEVILSIKDKGTFKEVYSTKYNSSKIPTSYAGHILKRFKNLGLITTKKVGRSNYVYLTDKGRELQNIITKLNNMF